MAPSPHKEGNCSELKGALRKWKDSFKLLKGIMIHPSKSIIKSMICCTKHVDRRCVKECSSLKMEQGERLWKAITGLYVCEKSTQRTSRKRKKWCNWCRFRSLGYHHPRVKRPQRKKMGNWQAVLQYHCQTILSTALIIWPCFLQKPASS